VGHHQDFLGVGNEDPGLNAGQAGTVNAGFLRRALTASQMVVALFRRFSCEIKHVVSRFRGISGHLLSSLLVVNFFQIRRSSLLKKLHPQKNLLNGKPPVKG